MSATIACPIASPTSVRAITAYLTDIHVDETYDFFAAKSILIRALGFTAAGATVSIPVLLADNPQKRVDYHLQQLTKACRSNTRKPSCGGARGVGKRGADARVPAISSPRSGPTESPTRSTNPDDKPDSPPVHAGRGF
jgi:hypothetical protein